MKIFRTNKIIAIALFLLLALSLLITYLPTASSATTNIITHAFLSVAPTTVGVNQQLTIVMLLDKPARMLMPGLTTTFYDTYTLQITKPDGNKQTLGPFTADWAATYTTYYTPDQTGVYTFQFVFPGQRINGTYLFQPWDDTYLPSQSPIINVTVQQQPVPYAPNTPLPTDYWQHPISADNYLWSSISGNWLGNGRSAFGYGGYNETGNFNPYTQAPNSAHIVWTKPLTFGGLVGGSAGTTPFYTGTPYADKFQKVVILQGRLYYNTPIASYGGFDGCSCVDLRTGELVWHQNYTITFAQTNYFISMNEMGYDAYLWDTTSVLGTFKIYDAFAGDLLVTITNAPVIPASPGGNPKFIMGPNGEVLEYVIDGSHSWLAMWNSTKALLPVGAAMSTLPLGATIDWSAGVQWNVTTPNLSRPAGLFLVPQTICLASADYLIANTGQTTNPDGTAWQTDVCYSAKDGATLWVQNRTIAEGAQNIGFMCGIGGGKYFEYTGSTMVLKAYDCATGQLSWTCGPFTDAWDMYVHGYGLGVTVAYNTAYLATWGGIHAIDVNSGKELWVFRGSSMGVESRYPYGSWATLELSVADGKVFAATGESHPRPPLAQGYNLFAINATTGEQVWNVSGMLGQYIQGPIIADGTVVTLNQYNMEIYAFGKGLSATTVSAPTMAMPQGTPVLIQGTVTDQSPGQTCLGIPAKGTPAISDQDMTAWMEYMYMQKPKPTDVTGVTVSLDVLDANGNYRNIGTATSDASGFYSYAWTPDIPGKYTVIATFAGSESYWGSVAETAFNVEEAPQSTPPPTPEPASMADIYILPGIIGINRNRNSRPSNYPNAQETVNTQKTRKTISPIFLGYNRIESAKGLRRLWTEKAIALSKQVAFFSLLL
jgi:hypothetical protein